MINTSLILNKNYIFFFASNFVKSINLQHDYFNKQKFHASLDKVPDSLHNPHHCSPYPSTLSLGGHHSHTHSSSHAPTGLHHPISALGAPPAANSILPKEEHSPIGGHNHDCSQDKSESSTSIPQQPKDTQYLSANCVLFSYFNGDIAASVDEHFTRSLSQSGSATQTSNAASSPGATATSCAAGESQSNKSHAWKSKLHIIS